MFNRTIIGLDRSGPKVRTVLHFCYKICLLGISPLSIAEDVKRKHIFQFWKSVEMSMRIKRKWMNYVLQQLKDSYGKNLAKHGSVDVLPTSNEPVQVILSNLFNSQNNCLRHQTTCKEWKLSGKFVLSNLCIQSKLYHWNSTVFFNPHFSFKINATFLIFSLSFGSQITDQDIAKDRYYNHLKYLIEFLTIEDTDSSKHENCTLYGIYPIHTRYFIHQKTTLSWSISSYFHSKIYIFYQIIDTGLVSKFNLSSSFNVTDAHLCGETGLFLRHSARSRV